MTTQSRAVKFVIAGYAFLAAALFLSFAWVTLAFANTPFLAFILGGRFIAYMLPLSQLVVAGYLIQKGVQTLKRTDDFGV